MKKESWKSTGTAVYSLHYHFVWSTKYRRKVLRGSVGETLIEAIKALCLEHGYE
jgi:putative transposase